jgi:phosphate transport system protein
MGGLVEDHFQGATKALLKGDTELASDIAKYDYKVNALEVEIDDDCTSLIARRQPTAGDLRNVFAVIKIVTDLERIGDESEKIASFVTELSVDTKSMTIYNSLKSMIKTAREILSAALYCYARLDAKQALEVAKLDEDLDSNFNDLKRTLITYLIEDVKNIEDFIRVMWCARSIERVGDHAKNICQYVVYVAHGNDIRHITDQKE